MLNVIKILRMYMNKFQHTAAFKNKLQLSNAAFKLKQPLLLSGPTGCGKTTYVHDLCAGNNKVLTEVVGFEGMSVQDLVGHYVIENESTVFKEGPLLRAVKKGSVFYFDEVDTVLPEVRRLLFSLLDHRRSLFNYATGEMLHAHPEFQFIGSYNPGLRSYQSDSAFIQRCVSIVFDYLDADAEAKVIGERTGVGAKLADSLVAIATELRASTSLNITPPSTRLLLQSAEMVVALDDSSAFDNVIEHQLLNALTDDKNLHETIIATLRAKGLIGDIPQTLNVMPFKSSLIAQEDLAEF